MKQVVKDGSYKLSLAVDGYIGNGTLTMVANNGQGHDGAFKLEVHVSGHENAMRGIVNVLLVTTLAATHHLPSHFSLDVQGSGTFDRFNLIGTGPRAVLVELDATWESEVTDDLYFSAPPGRAAHAHENGPPRIEVDG